jgi:tRNA(adenine34) deaminase
MAHLVRRRRWRQVRVRRRAENPHPEREYGQGWNRAEPFARGVASVSLTAVGPAKAGATEDHDRGRTGSGWLGALRIDARVMNSNLVHDVWMNEALALGRQAAAEGEIPVGAIVVHHPAGGAPRIIGRGYNRREAEQDPSAHAEIVALRQAGRELGTWRMVDCTLYATLEPCPMCAGAMVQGRLERLVYGCADPKAGAVDTLYHLCSDERLNHRVDVVSGVLADEAAALLKAFFAARR